MVRIIGVKQVICTCGKEMVRTGGVFGGSMPHSTYYCADCHKAVNVYDLPEESVAEMEDELRIRRR